MAMWQWEDRSSYGDAKLAARGRWAGFVQAFRDFTANQTPNHTPPGWVEEAGRETLQGNWVTIPVAYLNSPREQQQRAMAQMGPYDQTAAQSAALQAALAASLRAAQVQRR
jgi:hypothetical protein